MFFLLSKILDLFLSPYTWALVCFAFTIPWRKRSARQLRRSFRRRRAAGALGLGILLVASAGPVANAMTWKLEHGATSTMREGVTYDVVILLGGVVDEAVTAESGQPSYNDNVERVVMTSRILHENRAKLVIVSGGTMDPKLAAWGEARQLARQLEEWGVTGDRIIVEDRSRNTRENALFTKPIVEQRGLAKVLVITSAFHMPRAIECYRAVGMDVDVLPVDFRARKGHAGGFEWLPRASALAVTTGMTRELLGRYIYRAQGYGRAP